VDALRFAGCTRWLESVALSTGEGLFGLDSLFVDSDAGPPDGAEEDPTPFEEDAARGFSLLVSLRVGCAAGWLL